MEVFEGLPSGRYHFPVVAIGNFDGLHRGHQKLLSLAGAEARRHEGTLLVLTFQPHPQEVITPQDPPRLLVDKDTKISLLADMGVKVTVLYPFTREVAALTSQVFWDQVVLRGLAAKAVVVGYNFTFGAGGQGTPELMRRWGQEDGIEVILQQPVFWGDQPVSSSNIRKALQEGDLMLAAGLLGRDPAFRGLVVEGCKLGRTMGFPTANLKVSPRQVLPAVGVYAVMVKLLQGGKRQAVLNIGRRPTFGENLLPTVEVHLLDYQGDLYGQELEVILKDRLRGEQRFSSAEELADQIRRDVAEARRLMAGNSFQS